MIFIQKFFSCFGQAASVYYVHFHSEKMVNNRNHVELDMNKTAIDTIKCTQFIGWIVTQTEYLVYLTFIVHVHLDRKNPTEKKKYLQIEFSIFFRIIDRQAQYHKVTCLTMHIESNRIESKVNYRFIFRIILPQSPAKITYNMGFFGFQICLIFVFDVPWFLRHVHNVWMNIHSISSISDFRIEFYSEYISISFVENSSSSSSS